jgi:hypothetical protein
VCEAEAKSDDVDDAANSPGLLLPLLLHVFLHLHPPLRVFNPSGS